MFEEYLANQYIRAGLIMLIVLVVFRPLLFAIEKIVYHFTKKTETELDDLFIEKAYRPAAGLLILMGLFFAIQQLTLSNSVHTILTNLIYSAGAIIVFYTAYSFFDIVIVHTIKKRANERGDATRKSLLSLILSTLRVIFALFGFLYVLTIWGVEVGPFLAGLGIAGLAVALALQPTLANIFAGVGMILDKTLREGDLVYLDDKTKGTISKIGLRSTKIISFDNEFIIVPNSKLADSRIQNVTLPDPSSRAVITFMVAYGSNIEKVKKVVLREIKSVNHVLKDPEPSVRFTEMKDFGLEFKAYYFVDTFANRFVSIDEANTKIYNALSKNKIEIPYPQMDVRIRKR